MKLLKTFLSLTIALCFSASFSHAESKGPLYVDKVMPFLYQAVADSIGEERAHAIFREWSRPEANLCFQKLNGLLEQLAQPGLRKSEREKLQEDFHNKIVGTVGEAYGLSLLRAQYRESPGIKVIDEIEYALQNNQILEENGRPDGLAYSVRAGSLIIESVLESKVGNDLLRSQVESWLGRWKNDGLTVDGKHYGPDKILIRVQDIPKPLKDWTPETIERNILVVTASKPTKSNGIGVTINLSRDERKDISGRLVMNGKSQSEVSHFLRESDFINAAKNAIQKEVMSRLDRFENEGEKFTVPSTTDSGEEGALGGAIRTHFTTLKNFFSALPPKYQRLMREAGFDPQNPHGSVQRMRGSTKWDKASILEEIKHRLDRFENEEGKFSLPTIYDDGEEGVLGNAIRNHFKGLTNLYLAFSPEYQRLMREAGFDPENPRESAMRMRGSIKWNKSAVLEEIKHRLDRFENEEGKFNLLSSDEGEEGTLGEAIQRHFKRLTNLYLALPPKYRRLMRDAGFDPKNPRRSAHDMYGFTKWNKSKVLEEIKRRVDIFENEGGEFTLPSTRDEGEDGALGAAIFRQFKTTKNLYLALPPKYQRQMRTAGFDPENPIGSSMRMRSAARSENSATCPYAELGGRKSKK